MRQATMLHIPRTGGSSRRDALAKATNWYCAPHEFPLSKVPRDNVPVVFVREPVERFLSAYDYLVERGNRATLKRPESQWYAERDFMRTWSTAEALALDIDAAWDTIQQQSMVFRPMAWWFDVARDDVFIGRTETLRRDFDAIVRRTNTYASLPLPHRNGVHRGSTLSQAARGRIRTRYERDVAIWTSGTWT